MKLKEEEIKILLEFIKRYWDDYKEDIILQYENAKDYDEIEKLNFEYQTLIEIGIKLKEAIK